MGCGISSDTGTDVLGNNVTQNGRASLLHPSDAVQSAKAELEDLNLDDPELEQAATKIQAAFRGHRTRQQTKDKMAEEEQIDIDLNDPEVAEAATKIQASFRGHKVRKEMKTDGNEGGKKAEGEQAELTEKMEELQTNKEEADGGDKAGAVEEEVDLDLTDPDLSKAALKIQAQFRGNLGRKFGKKESS